MESSKQNTGTTNWDNQLLNNPELYDEIVDDVYDAIVHESPIVKGYINDKQYEMIDIDYDGECRTEVVNEYFKDTQISERMKDRIHDDALDRIRDTFLVYGYHDNPEIS